MSARIFHKHTLHEQLLLIWSNSRDCGMGTQLKYFWTAHENVMSTMIFSQKYVLRTLIFHVIDPSWF